SQAVTDSREAFLEIAPGEALRLRGGVQSALTGDEEARTTSLSAALKAPRWLDLSGSYKLRESPARDAVVSRGYTVALTPVRGVTVQGAYQENPEDSQGAVQDELHTSV